MKSPERTDKSMTEAEAGHVESEIGAARYGDGCR